MGFTGIDSSRLGCPVTTCAVCGLRNSSVGLGFTIIAVPVSLADRNFSETDAAHHELCVHLPCQDSGDENASIFIFLEQTFVVCNILRCARKAASLGRAQV